MIVLGGTSTVQLIDRCATTQGVALHILEIVIKLEILSGFHAASVALPSWLSLAGARPSELEAFHIQHRTRMEPSSLDRS